MGSFKIPHPGRMTDNNERLPSSNMVTHRHLEEERRWRWVFFKHGDPILQICEWVQFWLWWFDTVLETLSWMSLFAWTGSEFSLKDVYSDAWGWEVQLRAENVTDRWRIFRGTFEVCPTDLACHALRIDVFSCRLESEAKGSILWFTSIGSRIPHTNLPKPIPGSYRHFIKYQLIINFALESLGSKEILPSGI